MNKNLNIYKDSLGEFITFLQDDDIIVTRKPNKEVEWDTSSKDGDDDNTLMFSMNYKILGRKRITQLINQFSIGLKNKF